MGKPFAAILFAPTLVFAGTLWAGAGPSLTDMFREELSSLKDQRLPVLYSECRHRPELGGGTAVLFFPLGPAPIGEASGSLVEIEKAKVLRLSDIWVKDGKLLEETEGGVWSIARVEMLMDELSHYDFKLLHPGDLDRIWTSRPHRVCKDRQPVIP